MTKKLYRSEKDTIIAGVAGGLGEFFELDPSILRLIFIIMLFAGGSGFWVYLILWLILPKKSELDSDLPMEETMRKNVEEIKVKAKKAADTLKKEGEKHHHHEKQNNHNVSWLGVILLIAGGLMLVEQLGFLDSRFFWPATLVSAGLLMIMFK